MKRIIGLLLLFSVLVPFSVQAQELELAPRSPEQRLNAAYGNWMASLVLGIGFAKSEGRSVEEFAEYLISRVAPGWGEPGSRTPQSVVRSMYTNFMGMPGMEFEILEQKEGSVSARVNRPWADDFDENGMFWGVSLDELDKMWRLFNAGLANQLGFGYDDRMEDGWWYFTFSVK